jgi:drug/metabolite transporter (DMT)-like permease
MTNIPFIVTVLLLVDSLHFVFARMLLPKISPGVSAMYVLLIGTLQVGIYGLATRRLNLSALRPHLWFYLTIGLLVAASTNINYEAIAYIDAGTASMLAQSGTIFGLGLGMLWLREKLTNKQIGGALLAMVGVGVISFQPGDYLRLGALLVIGSTFLYSLHTAITKRYSAEIDFLNFFFFRLAFTTTFLFLFSLSRNALELPDKNVWPYLLLAGTVDISISRTMFYLALRRLTLSLHTIILTVSPVVAILWALGLFGTFPTNQQLLGGAAVLVGVLIASINRQK